MKKGKFGKNDILCLGLKDLSDMKSKTSSHIRWNGNITMEKILNVMKYTLVFTNQNDS